MSLAGRGAVVTGGGRGIGAAVAHALAERGAAVVVSARSEREIDGVAGSLARGGRTAFAIPCDVTREEAVAELARQAGELLGSVDVLVNSAGASSSAKLADLTLEEWNRLFAANATSTFLCTRALLPAMVARGWGRVVNIASVAGKVGAPYVAAYTAAKHAVIGFTRAVAAEVAASGVTVNAVCPGYVDTRMTARSIERIVEKTGADPETVRAKLRAMSPQRRLFEPEEIAHLVVSLCDPGAGGIHGQAVVVDGGAVQS